MKIKPGVANEIVRREESAACTPAPSLVPSERVISLLGSDEWALVIEALAMGDTRTATTRRRESPTAIPPGTGDG